MFREYFSNGLKPPGMGASCASKCATYFVKYERGFGMLLFGLKQKHPAPNVQYCSRVMWDALPPPWIPFKGNAEDWYFCRLDLAIGLVKS